VTQTGQIQAHNRREENGPPCRRCGTKTWDTERRHKSIPRWLLETVFAAPDVWIFQSESAGWPAREYELWTCTNCGRRARVAVPK
jgi:ribosomal protein L37E